MIRLRLLGAPTCWFDERELADLPAHRIRFAILAYLALERSAPRDELARLFWPDSSLEQARHALSQCLNELRQQLGEASVKIEDGHVHAGAEVSADATLFLERLNGGAVDEALSLYQGPFLHGFVLPDNVGFETWANSKRADLERAYQKAREEKVDPKFNLWTELKARRVPRMAAWYVGTVFLVLQGAGFIVEYFSAPILTVRAIAAVAVIAFPLTLIASWYFEVTPDGRIHRDPRAGRLRDEWRVLATGFLVGTSAVLAAFVAPFVPYSRADLNIVCPDGSPAPCTRNYAIEPNRYIVLPLTHGTGAAPELNGEICALLIVEGLQRWRELNVVDQARVQDELQKLTPALQARLPFDSAIDIARRLGAGKLITGQLWQLDNATRIDAFLYDVASGRQIDRATARFASGSTDTENTFHMLAAEFVADGGTHGGALGENSTTSLAARQALDSAMLRVASWDLRGARTYYERALQRDPRYPAAHLGLAQVLLWQGDTSDVWRVHADRAAAASSSFGWQNELLAQGLAHLANQRFSQACEAYRELVQHDQLNFYGWFGYGECLRRDPRVVADARSPSGWSFVTSWQQAIDAHKRALVLVPSFNRAFVNLGSSQLEKLLFMSVTKSRPGTAADGDSMRFAAWPQLIDDTLALVPYPYAEWREQAKPLSVHLVVQQHRNEWANTVSQWAQHYPNSPQALEASAWSLELAGRLLPGGKTENSALTMLQRARKLGADSSNSVRLAAAETRVLVKAQRFRDARRVAVRAMRENADPSALDAQLLAGLAGMTGRVHDMVHYLDVGVDSIDFDTPLSGQKVGIPTPLAQATARLLAYSYVGAPVDSVRALSERAHQALHRMVSLEERITVHQTGLDRAARMNFGVLGLDDAHEDADRAGLFIREQAALARGDLAGLRASLDTWAERMQRQNPTDFASDGVLTYAQLRLALRDTAEATAVLDRYLADLHNLQRGHFRQPWQPASIVRLMAPRADLAAAARDRTNARRWSRAVLELWKDGDRELQPVLKRMRSHSRL